MRTIQIPQRHFESLVGRLDENLKALEKALPVRVSTQGNELHIEGEEQAAILAEGVLARLIDLMESGYSFSQSDVKTAVNLLEQDPKVDLKKFFLSNKVIPSAKKHVVPKSFNQKKYIEAIQNYDLVFGNWAILLHFAPCSHALAPHPRGLSVSASLRNLS